MTHEYTLLVGGTILPGPGEQPCSAMAWANGTVLLLGTDDQVRSISRGDSTVVDLHGAFVVPIGAQDRVEWPPSATVEIGGPADFAILPHDPRERRRAAEAAVTLVRGGHPVRGSLPPRQRQLPPAGLLTHSSGTNG